MSFYIVHLKSVHKGYIYDAGLYSFSCYEPTVYSSAEDGV